MWGGGGEAWRRRVYPPGVHPVRRICLACGSASARVATSGRRTRKPASTTEPSSRSGGGGGAPEAAAAAVAGAPPSMDWWKSEENPARRASVTRSPRLAAMGVATLSGFTFR